MRQVLRHRRNTRSTARLCRVGRSPAITRPALFTDPCHYEEPLNWLIVIHFSQPAGGLGSKWADEAINGDLVLRANSGGGCRRSVQSFNGIRAAAATGRFLSDRSR
jgi:hypothetical protein